MELESEKETFEIPHVRKPTPKTPSQGCLEIQGNLEAMSYLDTGSRLDCLGRVNPRPLHMSRTATMHWTHFNRESFHWTARVARYLFFRAL